jgi:hypothetical protein
MVEIPTDLSCLQEGGKTLFRSLFESRLIMADHTTALFLNGKTEAAKKPLKKIKSAGFITERPHRRRAGGGETENFLKSCSIGSFRCIIAPHATRGK